MPRDSDADLDRRVEQYRAATLPAPEWTHRVPLAVGILGHRVAITGALLDYYSKATPIFVAARRGWVEPDVKSLRGTS